MDASHGTGSKANKGAPQRPSSDPGFSAERVHPSRPQQAPAGSKPHITCLTPPRGAASVVWLVGWTGSPCADGRRALSARSGFRGGTWQMENEPPSQRSAHPPPFCSPGPRRRWISSRRRSAICGRSWGRQRLRRARAAPTQQATTSCRLRLRRLRRRTTSPILPALPLHFAPAVTTRRVPPPETIPHRTTTTTTPAGPSPRWSTSATATATPTAPAAARAPSPIAMLPSAAPPTTRRTTALPGSRGAKEIECVSFLLPLVVVLPFCVACHLSPVTCRSHCHCHPG